ncbi:MAG: hydantoinase/oxoprolinase N-terminal domain-containing protein [Candidatus Bipolaricaulota bacterium]
MMGIRLAIDIGGTFTDLVALDEGTGEIILVKALTTPANFEGEEPSRTGADRLTETLLRLA